MKKIKKAQREIEAQIKVAMSTYDSSYDRCGCTDSRCRYLAGFLAGICRAKEIIDKNIDFKEDK